MQVEKLGSQINQALREFEKELVDEAGLAACYVKYNFELNDIGEIRDNFKIIAYHEDPEDDGNKEYEIIFETNSLNMIYKRDVIRYIKSVMAEDTKEQALVKFKEIWDEDYNYCTGLRIAELEDYSAKDLEWRDDMVTYKIGEKYDVFKGQEGVVVDISDSGMDMIVRYNNPTDSEIDDFRNGEFKMEITGLVDVLFFLVKFGSQQWMDAPYNVHLSKNLTKLETPAESEGYALTVYFADGITGELKVARLIGLSHKVSMRIKGQVENQRDYPFTEEGYAKALKAAYEKFDTKDLLRMKYNY